MAEIKWIKLNVDMFDNSKIKFIRKLPSGNDIVLFWIMLLTKAGKCNSNGYIMLTETIPYDIDMLANEFDFELNTVKLAVETFSKLNMIEVDNAFFLPGWADHQNIDGLEKIKEQNRKRVAEHRERKKLEALPPATEDGCNVTSNVTVTESNVTVTEQNKNKNKDIDKDKDKELYMSDSNEYRLASYLFNYIKKNNPSAKEPNFQTWSSEFDKILRIDKRDLEEVKKVIAWCQQDSFWLVNILSPKKLREKYDQLLLKMKNEYKPKKNGKQGNFNNFEQRQYDFDELENKLRGNQQINEEEIYGQSVDEQLKAIRGH